MTPSISVSLPIPPSSLSPNGRPTVRERIRDRRDYRSDAGWEIKARLGPDWQPWQGPVRIHVVWTVTHPAHIPDIGNAIARLKQIEDAAADAGLYRDDSQITAITVERVVGRPKGVQLTFTREDG